MDRKRTVISLTLLIMLSLTGAKLSGQELVFEKQSREFAKRPDFGPNRRYFYHLFLSSSLFTPSPVTFPIKTKQPFTGQIAMGFRFKLKVIKPLSVITEVGINKNYYNLQQIDGKVFPDTLLHRSQSIRTSGLYGGIAFRIRLGQRGDYLGNYIDFGLNANTSLLNQLVTKDDFKANDPKLYLSQKTTFSGLEYITRNTYKATLRLGFDRFSLTASYRLNKILRFGFEKDLPNLEIGLEFSPVRY